MGRLVRTFSTLILACFLFSASFVFAANQKQPSKDGARVGLPSDWSHARVVYSGKLPTRLNSSMQRDPRLLKSLLDRYGKLTPEQLGVSRQKASEWRINPKNLPPPLPWHKKKEKNVRSKVDWAIALGPTGGVPANVFPAKYQFDVTQPISCLGDFAVFPIAAYPVVGAQANLVAFNNLYSGPTGTPACGLATATTMWSYAVGTGPIVSSPVLSLDGSKVVVVEQSGTAIFHVVTGVAGQGTSPTTPVAPAIDLTLDYTTLTSAGCPTAVPARNGQSSPYVDYSADVAYIGADSGYLYRITNVFGGTPTLDACVQVSTAALSSPVYDQLTGQVIVADGQKIYSVASSPGSLVAGSSVAVSDTPDAMRSSPLVDPFNGNIFAFLSKGNSTNAVVTQLKTDLTGAIEVPVGPSFTNGAVYNFFDNFNDNSLARFTASPLTDTKWSASGGVAVHGGAPTTFSQRYRVGGATWTDYDFNLRVTFPSGTAGLFPGGVRVRTNETTGAGYAIWLYPNPGKITIFSTGQWDIDSGNTLLNTVNLPITLDTPHQLQVRIVGPSILVYLDGVFAVAATDSTYSSGTVALDGGSAGEIRYDNVEVVNLSASAGQLMTSGFVNNSYVQNGPANAKLYTCGRQAGAATKPSLYTLGFDGSGALLAGPLMSDNRNIGGTADGSCSPMLEFFDGTTDRIFVGVGAGPGSSAGANLVTMWNLTSNPLVLTTDNTSAASATAVNEIGGTSGFVIDNSSTASEASSIYFGTLSNQGATTPCGVGMYCAVKLTQSALQ